MPWDYSYRVGGAVRFETYRILRYTNIMRRGRKPLVTRTEKQCGVCKVVKQIREFPSRVERPIVNGYIQTRYLCYECDAYRVSKISVKLRTGGPVVIALIRAGSTRKGSRSWDCALSARRKAPTA